MKFEIKRGTESVDNGDDQIWGVTKMKKCPKCRKSKEKSEFSKNRSRRNGLSDWCKKCERARVREYQNKKRGGKPSQKRYKYERTHRVVARVRQKRCRRCMKWKAESEFHRHRGNKDGLDFRCKGCVRKARKLRAIMR